MSSEWSVEGYFAKNKSEYEAFLRDSKKISSIKARLDLTKPSNIEKLYSTICTGGIKFDSKLGFDFEDEITEKYENNLKKSSGYREICNYSGSSWRSCTFFVYGRFKGFKR